jgi:short subunit dehydrogenase-like uncharacterized protein
LIRRRNLKSLLARSYLQSSYPRYISLGQRGPCAWIGNAASPAAVVILTATVDPMTAEEVCGIAWLSICRRGAPRERNDPDLWVNRLHRETHRKAASDRGARPILAGRNLDKVKRVAQPLGLSARAFDLGDPVRVDAAIKDVSVVLCAAGPFSATSRPMADACLRHCVHYLDITGKIDVFEALAARDAEAKARGVMLLPGVGFDVVPSDCLAAHLKRRLPDANELRLYLSLGANMSRGTGKTMIESIAAGTRMRRKGRIVSRDRAEVGSCDFGEGEKLTIQVSWGDVATAFHSTSIPNIDVHFEASPVIRVFARTPWFLKSFLGLAPMQSLLKSQVDRLPEGPSEADRRAGQVVLVGQARNDQGQTARSRMRTPEGYSLTAATAFDAACRVLAGEIKPGFQTPSSAFGADYILNFDGVVREDLNR